MGARILDIFDFRDDLIGDYADYVRSFVHIRDDRVAAQVDEALESGRLWPQSLLQLNPSFEPGGGLERLASEGVLHSRTPEVFRVGKSADDPIGTPLPAHRHQIDALRVAHGGHPYVVTTGTGSGKSLAYMIPIVDHVLRNGSGKGIQAIVVYPMNALANSQLGELEKFLHHGFPDGSPVTFKRYTGQDDDAKKQAIIANPPDILLTNYVMLELILTRPQERKLVAAAQGLRFLVFDELHTYRGRQGADVAMLIRRVRERVGGEALQCIGTSATMSSEGTYLEKQRQVARVASKVFGVDVAEDHVIGETLQRVTPEIDLDDPEIHDAIRRDLADVDAVLARGYDLASKSTLASWVETTFGIEPEPGTHRPIRARPKRLHGEDGAAAHLAQRIGLDAETVTAAVERFLLKASDLRSDTGRPLFAFRLHQFVSKGDAIYATPDDAATRYVTLDAQRYAPGQRGEASLLPLAFCRECGHEYYTVWRGKDDDTEVVTPRRLSDMDGGEDLTPGFLYASDESPWPAEGEAAYERLPADWLETNKAGELRVKSHQRSHLPKPLHLDANGRQDPSGKVFLFVPAPFRFCLSCGVAYPGRRNDFAKLNVFSSEGRATSTTILSLAAIQRLKNSDLQPEARKLLSFTDNRQDAALQAGHFNDFIDVGLLRGGLYRAVADAGSEGLRHDEIARRVQEVLDLPFESYALDPTVILAAKRQTDDVLRGVLAYRLFQDLKRGWRINLPNLEQVGLLRITYPDLAEASAHEDLWSTRHPALANATPAERERLGGVLLDLMRRNLAILAEPLNRDHQEALRSRSGTRLREPWSIHEREKLTHASVLLPRTRSDKDPRDYEYLSGRSAFARFLRRDGVLHSWTDGTSIEESEKVIRDLLDALQKAGLTHVALPPKSDGQVPGYQVNADAMRWGVGDGTPYEDPLVRVRAEEGEKAEVERAEANAYFARYYREVASGLTGIRAAEHTAQVPNDSRMEREEQFREGALPVLYCSPTMELGVDIASLNVVNLRNVPPTPANYAQRSGRAGRSGQPAMVFTYCSTWSAHDQYFFKRQEDMVAGVVSAPRLDLGNEELVKAHVHAIWLAETGIDLGQSLKDVLDVHKDNVPLLPSIAEQIDDPKAQDRARKRAERMLATLGSDLDAASWFHSEWLADTLRSVRVSFDATAHRWRDLYRAALAQMDRQNQVIRDASADPVKRRRAERLRMEARVQRDLLIDAASAMHSDFFSYRYFASEGFLPGYSFPRLPLSAYIPARISRSGADEYVSRPRFLAVSEFGPGAVIYHDGGKYRVNRVILPPSEDGEEGVAQGSAKRCPACGYLHIVGDQSDPDLCERCGERLEPALTDLLRMQNVTTKRLERINSDEEERQRQGYEVITGYRFAVERGVPQRRTAHIKDGDAAIARLDYGQAATLWRLNLGWRRRKDASDLGFLFDVEQGFWATERDLEAQDERIEEDADPLSKSIRKVIPYVEDRRNLLVWSPERDLDAQTMASLQAALKNAIQIEYQLEDMELAAEALPTRDDRRAILFFEAAEGGAGVLRSLVEEPAAVRRVARRALAILHFDPDTGEDLGKAPGSRERCEAACYDCLMSYGNQMDHELLDRFLVKPHLEMLVHAEVDASPTGVSRGEHLARLETLCDSELEKRFLRALHDSGRRLPDEAQALIDLGGSRVRPDFVYRDHYTLVYVDGPVHDYPDRQKRDEDAAAAANDAGWYVLRFHHEDDWEELFREHAYLFGSEDA